MHFVLSDRYLLRETISPPSNSKQPAYVQPLQHSLAPSVFTDFGNQPLLRAASSAFASTSVATPHPPTSSYLRPSTVNQPRQTASRHKKKQCSYMASPRPSTVTLKRGGRGHDLQPQQVNVENLRRLFKVSRVCKASAIVLHLLDYS